MQNNAQILELLSQAQFSPVKRGMMWLNSPFGSLSGDTFIW
jgi:hypothetical protein